MSAVISGQPGFYLVHDLRRPPGHGIDEGARAFQLVSTSRPVRTGTSTSGRLWSRVHRDPVTLGPDQQEAETAPSWTPDPSFDKRVPRSISAAREAMSVAARVDGDHFKLLADAAELLRQVRPADRQGSSRK